MDKIQRLEDQADYIENNIAIYTRVDGGNRGCGYGEEVLIAI